MTEDSSLISQKSSGTRNCCFFFFCFFFSRNDLVPFLTDSQKDENCEISLFYLHVSQIEINVMKVMHFYKLVLMTFDGFLEYNLDIPYS